MLIDDRARKDLHTALESALGTTEADTLMAHLPPVGWADVATKRDLELLELRLTNQFTNQFNGAFTELRREMHSEIRDLFHKVLLSQAATVLTIVVLLLGVVAFVD